MRNTLLALVLAAGALGVATTASQAGYGHHGYQQSYDYQPSYDYQQTSSYYDCRTVSFRVWDEYSCEYVYRTKEVCN